MEENKENGNKRGPLASAAAGAVSVGVNMMKEKFTEFSHDAAIKKLKASANFPMIRLPEGYEIEKIVEGLTYPTSVCWDDQGTMYIAEAGGTFLDEDNTSARILRIDEGGRTTEIVNLDDKGIYPSVVGLTWHNGAFYFTHREPDLSGAVSKVTPDGTVTKLFGGIVDSKSDHQTNDIRMGPDGRMYVCVGSGGNTGVMDQSQMPFILKAPDGHATAAKDIVLRGVNLKIPDFRTKKLGDFVLTGAFVPFGTETHPGQVIKGSNKAGGTVLVFDPDNAEATVQPYAWGFRNVVGMAWDKEGEMFVCQNGYDNVPSRPINDAYDPSYRVKEGAWYGWPDFTASLDPVTDMKYKPFGSMVAPHYINGEKLNDGNITFLIDHEASGLSEPDKSLLLGLHEINSSPSMPDVAPDSWGEFAGHLFVPEWGDMAWFNNASRDKPAGNKISRINPKGDGEQDVEFFILNKEPGPASKQGELGQGIERPFCLRFGPDGAMYIADFGQHLINLNRIADGHLPFEFVPRTGVIWKVTKTERIV